jgi:hypothetical protein
MKVMLISAIVVLIMMEITEWKNNHKDPKWRKGKKHG